MDETKNNSVVPCPNLVQENHPSYDQRDNYPDEYFNDYMHDDPYYDSKCLSCSHWIGSACGVEQGVCDYEPY